jgi:hypothetical protein
MLIFANGFIDTCPTGSALIPQQRTKNTLQAVEANFLETLFLIFTFVRFHFYRPDATNRLPKRPTMTLNNSERD